MRVLLAHIVPSAAIELVDPRPFAFDVADAKAKRLSPFLQPDGAVVFGVDRVGDRVELVRDHADGHTVVEKSLGVVAEPAAFG